MMTNLLIVLFCLAAGLSLGNIAGTSMSMALGLDLPAVPYIGAVMGGILGLLFSPLFLLRKCAATSSRYLLYASLLLFQLP